MTKLKIRNDVITHNLGEEFNEELEAFIATLIICDHFFSRWSSAKVQTLGGHYVISVVIEDKPYNLIFKVNAKQELQSFVVYDFQHKTTIEDDIFNYLYKQL